MGRKQTYDQICPLATGLDLIGNRWAILVIRELMLGPRRFKDIHAELETASTDMVTSRLRELTESGLVHHRADRRYELTETGGALRPVLRALNVWSQQVGFEPTSAEITNATRNGVDLHRRLLTRLGNTLSTSAIRSANVSASLNIGHLRVSLRPSAQGYEVAEVDDTMPNQPPPQAPRGPSTTNTITIDPTAFIRLTAGGAHTRELLAEGQIQLVGEHADDILADIQAGLDTIEAQANTTPASQAIEAQDATTTSQA